MLRIYSLELLLQTGKVDILILIWHRGDKGPMIKVLSEDHTITMIAMICPQSYLTPNHPLSTKPYWGSKSELGFEILLCIGENILTC